MLQSKINFSYFPFGKNNEHSVDILYITKASSIRLFMNNPHQDTLLKVKHFLMNLSQRIKSSHHQSFVLFFGLPCKNSRDHSFLFADLIAHVYSRHNVQNGAYHIHRRNRKEHVENQSIVQLCILHYHHDVPNRKDKEILTGLTGLQAHAGCVPCVNGLIQGSFHRPQFDCRLCKNRKS